MKNDDFNFIDGYIEYTVEVRRPRRGASGPGLLLLLLALIILTALTAASPYFLPQSEQTVTPEPLGTASTPPATENYAEPGTLRSVQIDIVPLPGDETVMSYSEVYTKCVPSVTAVYTKLSGRILNSGTGIIVNSDGMILTCAHLLDGADSTDIVLSDGRVYAAQTVASDSVSDLMLLQISAVGLTPAEFGSSASVGDTLLLLGNPINRTLLLTDGILSGITENANVNGYSTTVIMTNAVVETGHSGAPLLNLHGQVVGIANASMRVTDGSSVSVNFALPAEVVKSIVDDLIQYGRVPGRPSLGVDLLDIQGAYAKWLDIPEGAFVNNVRVMPRESVAGAALMTAYALQPRDIITAIDGTEVASVAELMTEVNKRAVGDTVTLTVWRQGVTEEIEITLVEN